MAFKETSLASLVPWERYAEVVQSSCTRNTKTLVIASPMQIPHTWAAGPMAWAPQWSLFWQLSKLASNDDFLLTKP